MENVIAAALAARPKVELADPALSAAAVVVPLFRLGDDLGAVFIRRTHTVETHKGQYAFPGGFAEQGDETLAATALREFEEELGVAPHDVRLVGELDDIATIYRVRISPFVGLIPHPYPFRPNPDEVDLVVELALHRLAGPGVRTVEEIRGPSGTYRDVTFYRLDGHTIWGATGTILDQLLLRLGLLE
ncbi:MAG: CoA pyrophosphatase [Candidatus Sericytochromatia bacterium]|nr:CoA pyrophosphatase [Candidatus Tanganyikabacteria bacterium]